MNRKGAKCRGCRHGNCAACKRASYRKHGCACTACGPHSPSPIVKEQETVLA